ncbi:hypothetical protein RHGRI_025887 [Rhododendron griersonianum]|uniref:Haloacid dehalogenase-like hydrolase domain-containing protein n=1 Tax=Rhododendron griersonianum TaxID=479676 RepID=A0AAV6IQP9_9ERIC|nr:hypothetical protein RHGRI_025887 [Rhododendron griersonianum]
MPPLLTSRALSSLFLSTRSFPSMATPLYTTTASVAPKSRLRGVVFDMDGTLTVPVIDFQAMYRAVLGEEEYLALKSRKPFTGIDILHHIENWSPDKQRRAYEIIADFEQQGLDRLQIMPGASKLCGFLDSRNIRRGLITRNVKAAVDLFHLRFGITFAPALSREFRPYKPDPAPLLHICSTWDVLPNEVMMIGDSLKDDIKASGLAMNLIQLMSLGCNLSIDDLYFVVVIACGKRAGAFTCLLDETGRYDTPEFENVAFKPDYKVSSLAEVYSLLEANFDLIP